MLHTNKAPRFKGKLVPKKYYIPLRFVCALHRYIYNYQRIWLNNPEYAAMPVKLTGSRETVLTNTCQTLPTRLALLRALLERVLTSSSQTSSISWIICLYLSWNMHKYEETTSASLAEVDKIYDMDKTRKIILIKWNGQDKIMLYLTVL